MKRIVAIIATLEIVASALWANSCPSIVETDPCLFQSSRRYPKWFGSGFTDEQNLLHRPELTGNWGECRKNLIDVGIYFDVSVTQIAQSNIYGGNSTNGLRYGGSADYWLSVDTGQLGLWPCGLFVLHAETGFGENVARNAGSLIPVNFDATMPRVNRSGLTTLSEYYLIQTFFKRLILMAGKMDMAVWVDQNCFANNERTQFLHTGLVNNPIIRLLAPYTSSSAACMWLLNQHNIFTVGVIDSRGKTTEFGLNRALGKLEGTSYLAQYSLAHEIVNNRPGHIRLIAGHTTKRSGMYFGSRKNNQFFAANFDQYLSTKNREEGTGWGLFGRIGYVSNNCNVIDQFYSIGIGGKGCLLSHRKDDSWGLGWTGSHIPHFFPKKEFEHAFEGFYNIKITPATHLTLDSQFIFHPVEARRTHWFYQYEKRKTVADDKFAAVLGMRLQLDF